MARIKSSLSLGSPGWPYGRQALVRPKRPPSHALVPRSPLLRSRKGRIRPTSGKCSAPRRASAPRSRGVVSLALLPVALDLGDRATGLPPSAAYMPKRHRTGAMPGRSHGELRGRRPLRACCAHGMHAAREVGDLHRPRPAFAGVLEEIGRQASYRRTCSKTRSSQNDWSRTRSLTEITSERKMNTRSLY